MPYQEIVHLDEEKLKTKDACFVNKLKKFETQLKNTRKLVVNRILNSNMTIGYGTDLVSVYDNFDCWREFKAWREEGIPALKTLKAATSVNAQIVGRPDIGSIEPGQIADIAAWSKDILEDPEAISTCDFVMKEGQVVKKCAK
jgi:imidazolonepropionase-like amidohydrolase